MRGIRAWGWRRHSSRVTGFLRFLVRTTQEHQRSRASQCTLPLRVCVEDSAQHLQKPPTARGCQPDKLRSTHRAAFYPDFREFDSSRELQLRAADRRGDGVIRFQGRKTWVSPLGNPQSMLELLAAVKSAVEGLAGSPAL